MGGTLILWLHLQITTVQTVVPNVKDGSVGIQDILASFLESERKWRRVVHLWSTLHKRYRSFPPYWPVGSIIRATYTRSLMFLTSNTVFLPHTEV